MTAKLLVVGGGRMGEALVGGLVASGWAVAPEITIVEKLDDRRSALRERFPGVSVVAHPEPAAGVLLAVKPADADDACGGIARAGTERVLSIAAGVPIERLESVLGPGVHVVRAMPNTPALVGQGAAAIAAGSTADDDDLRWAESLLSSVGVVVRVPERLLDAVTGLSGSGPAYVFLVAEALIDAGVLAGLPRDVSATLAVQTLVGSAALLAGGESPEVLRAAVTSPGGTTAAGLRALETRAVRSAFLEAVMAATERSRDLGAAG
ncbi:MAG TPA: pyrroline-5-carboxylate reductase [Acidimicrobiales bacterium]|nr:pyrroline-5-carboxylate reductase [Acidimicrobiales bacterium]